MLYAVLLGGVNIGGRTVKSDELKKCFIKAGFKDPQPVLATGNVVIESKKSADSLRREIEALLLKEFKFAVRVFVISFDVLKNVVNAYPFTKAGSEYHRYIIFRESDTELSLSDLQLDDKTEAVLPGRGIVYWRVLKGLTLDSIFAKHLAKISRKEFSTTRNVNTLEKILTKG